MKDDETKSKVLLKDGLKELIESYPSIFDLFVKNIPKKLADNEEDFEYKKLSREIFSYGFNFLERYGTLYEIFKNLIASKISINTANDDLKDFVFNLTKGYNVSSFFNKNEIRDLGEINLYEKARLKALEILLKCEKSTTGIKELLPKIFSKDITEDQKNYFIKCNEVI